MDSSLKVGDVVARKSYGMDVIFKVVDIKQEGSEIIAILKGSFQRLLADAPVSDLVPQTEEKSAQYVSKQRKIAESKKKGILVSSSRIY